MSKVFLHQDNDPEMAKACSTAKQTFRIFWRELLWERHRIVPGLDLACVKFPFVDPPSGQPQIDTPEAEQMWLSDCSFDGATITGTLINSPNWLKSVKEGDTIRKPISEMSDWMYAVSGKVYGGFTVHLLRKQMSNSERRSHDNAWGLDFGDPETPRLAPAEWYSKTGETKSSFFGKLLAKPAPNLALEEIVRQDHPMAVSMSASFEKHLNESPDELHSIGDDGMSLLHVHCLAGSTPIVDILLKHGADPNAAAKNGMTPLRLAKLFSWSRIIDLLTKAGAKA
jgi:uncharacterized protein YegJ (DUF2314 family)